MRIGVGEAHAPAIYKSPKYGYSDSWTMKEEPEVTAFAKRFLTLMAATPYGPYEATKLVFGVAAADALALDSFTGAAQYAAPRPLRQSPAKRSHTEAMSSDDQSIAQDHIMRPSSSKRPRR